MDRHTGGGIDESKQNKHRNKHVSEQTQAVFI